LAARCCGGKRTCRSLWRRLLDGSVANSMCFGRRFGTSGNTTRGAFQARPNSYGGPDKPRRQWRDWWPLERKRRRPYWLLRFAREGEFWQTFLGPEQNSLDRRGSAARRESPSGEPRKRIWSAFTESDVVVVSRLHRPNGAREHRIAGPRRVGFDGGVFLAHELRASRCRLVKDVDGLYASDPKIG